MRATMVDPRGRASVRADGSLRVRKPPLSGPLGSLGSLVFEMVVRARNARFDRGERVERMPIPVISVGNLSVGGTGKTPMVMWVIRALAERNVRAAIAMRGYGAKRGGRSDEHEEYLERLWDLRTPVAAAPKRAPAIRDLLSRDATIQAVVLDDGFQHRFVARDADIVLVDATRNPFEDRCLPGGWLREPVASLARAQAVVLTRADHVDHRALAELRSKLEAVAPRACVAGAIARWDAIETPEGEIAPSELGGLRAHVVCAIGNPEAFVGQARAFGAVVNSIDALRDHAPYTPGWMGAMLDRARDRRCDVVLTTGKDWMKMRDAMPTEPSRQGGKPVWPEIWRPRASVAWVWGESEIRATLERACARRG